MWLCECACNRRAHTLIPKRSVGAGEGDTARHLAGAGFRPGYEQDPRAEFDFGVAALAVDLRSGVRLLRMAEALTGARGLVAAGHFPAERRPLQVGTPTTWNRLHRSPLSDRILLQPACKMIL